MLDTWITWSRFETSKRRGVTFVAFQRREIVTSSSCTCCNGAPSSSKEQRVQLPTESSRRGACPACAASSIASRQLIATIGCQIESPRPQTVAIRPNYRAVGRRGLCNDRLLTIAIGATMVHLRLNEKEATRNPHINFIRALPELPDEDEALIRLTQLAALFRPIMKEYGFSINSLVEVRRRYQILLAGKHRRALTNPRLGSTSTTRNLRAETGMQGRRSRW